MNSHPKALNGQRKIESCPFLGQIDSTITPSALRQHEKVSMANAPDVPVSRVRVFLRLTFEAK
jgi:hypothetical protein